VEQGFNAVLSEALQGSTDAQNKYQHFIISLKTQNP